MHTCSGTYTTKRAHERVHKHNHSHLRSHSSTHTHTVLMCTNVLRFRITQTHTRTRGPSTQSHATISFRQLLQTGSGVQWPSLGTPVCARLWSNSCQTSITSTVDEQVGPVSVSRAGRRWAGRRWAACDVTSDAQHVVAQAIKQRKEFEVWSSQARSMSTRPISRQGRCVTLQPNATVRV